MRLRVAADDEEPVADAEPWVALLPGLDPTTMGWKERAWYLPDACSDTFDRMGNAGPTLWVDGQVVGGWVQSADGEIRMRAYVDLSDARRRELRDRADELAKLLGDTRFTVRFPSTLSATLFKAEEPDDLV